MLDQIVLKSLQEALAEEMIKVAVDKALEKHRAGQGAKLDRRTTIARELSLIAAKQEHLVDAIAAGDKTRRILDRLNAEEARREELIRELEAIERAGAVGFLDEARLKRELKTRLANMRGLLERHVSSARRLLNTLLQQPLRFEAVQEGDQRRYRILGTGSYLPLLPELPTPLNSSEKSLLPGVWCPQRDLRGFALPQRWEYVLKGSLKLLSEGIGDGQTILPSLAALESLLRHRNLRLLVNPTFY